MLTQWLNKSERFNQLATYLYIPYQFLQIAGYRLVGKQCQYQWGKYRPEPIGAASDSRHIIALMFPPVLCCMILALQIAVSFYLFARYYTPQNSWSVFFILIQPLPFSLYGGWMILDLLRLRRLIKG